MNDSELTALALRFQAGDRESFRSLVEALTRPLIATAYRYTGDWEWARDLTQDTWVRVFRGIGRYDGRRPFPAWLRAIHRNVCLDHLRRPWVRHEEAAHPDALARVAAPPHESPSRVLERSDLLRRIRAAAAHLSEIQRQVFVRVDLEQRPQQAVAGELGLKFTTLRATLHHARRKVAALLRGVEEIP